MIIDGKRSLAHVEKVAWIKPIEGADNIELIGVLGWTCIAKIGEFKEGDHCVYIEIDSKVPEKEWSEFLRAKKFKIKTMKLGKFNVISQGLALPVDFFDVEIPKQEGTDVTELLEIKYSNPDDQRRKSDGPNEIEEASNEIFESSWAKWLMKRSWGKDLMFYLFGTPKDVSKRFPTKFDYISKTDQERCENMPEILKDKTPFIRTQKCDGSSATYILEKVKSSFIKTEYEFYVCSRNMRIFRKDDDPLVDSNDYYWEMAEKYEIEENLEDYLKQNKDCKYVCWQGEICGPKIQGNPQGLHENHLFCFHMIDSEKGVFDIREAKKYWDIYDMESVPIESMTYILPDDFEEFKKTADGNYDSSVCEGQTDRIREGWVYYKTNDPSFSFKNISRKYLLKKDE
ncbi:RNA ligase family protein [uncultured Methanobrevibacter sp.]|uniref:RNA ligase family protein n=1 Tax=uncultured Methanobrevibacter sp. TaxID=253161 RepID=UPI0026180F6E|nr:RNA ligase family protein [uncultured Methanobrevibacter sp.]